MTRRMVKKGQALQDHTNGETIAIANRDIHVGDRMRKDDFVDPETGDNVLLLDPYLKGWCTRKSPSGNSIQLFIDGEWTL